MKTRELILLAVSAVVLVTCAYMPPPIEFSTTAETDRGAMYLGNGEIGALAWVSKDGTLHTVLQRSDNWNEGGQHVKIGGLDYVTGRPVDDGSFHQTVSLADGTFEAVWKSAGAPVRVHYRLHDGVDFAVCEVVGGRNAQTKMVNARIYPQGFRSVSTHELQNEFVEGRAAKEVSAFDISSDVVVPDGWCHVNAPKTVETLLKWYDYWQATADCGPRDFLRDRAFGCLTRRSVADDRTLFLSAVTCWHPCASVDDWTQRTRALLDAKGWSLAEEPVRRAAHAAAWHAFWDRSHIAVTPRAGVAYGCIKPGIFNPKLPVTIGAGSAGNFRWEGEVADVKLEINGKTVYQAAHPKIGERIKTCRPEDIANGYTFSCRFKLANPKAPQRLFDCVTSGKNDGTLIDVCGGLRVIACDQARYSAEPLRAGKEESIRVVVSPAGGITLTRNGRTEVLAKDNSLAEECRAVSAAWANQRYLSRCVGRGQLPIRFNGSLFTASQHGSMDYRQWGHGYWWQNTRLAYYPMFAAGDVEMTEPLFRMYVDSLLEFNKKRTRKYLNHGGAYFPECIQPWGDHFVGTYGFGRPWAARKDKLQDSHWHKYEWVGQLELSLMLLERLAFTEDIAWFKAKAMPAIREYVAYFDQHYSKNSDGIYVMDPAQALETYQRNCANAMPEIAGLHAVVARLLALEKGVLTDDDRALFTRIQKALPPLPTRKLANGETVFAPAQKYAGTNNCELPELYCVYPFRLCSFEKPNAAQGWRTYEVRKFRLFHGWGQDELFAATLGKAEEARRHFVNRVLTHSNRAYRWPACWGPNFNTCPDGDEGSNIQNIPQQMLLQYEGRKIFLLPAWPKDWNCCFKLHAPYRTTVEGRVANGELKDLVVTPAARRADVTLGTGWTLR